MDAATGQCTDMDACATYPCDENAACADGRAPPASAATPPSKQWMPPEASVGDRTCVCLQGYKGDGELCISDGSVTAKPEVTTIESASASGTDGEDTTTILVIFVTLVILTVVIVSMFVYSMYCKPAIGSATFNPRGSMDINAFNNPMYQMGGQQQVMDPRMSMQMMGGQQMMQPSAAPQYAVAQAGQTGDGQETYGPMAGEDGAVGYIAVNGATADEHF